MKTRFKQFQITVFVMLAVLLFSVSAWSAISLPTANLSGDLITTAADLTFNVKIYRVDYQNGDFAVGNDGLNETIINAQLVLTGANRTGPLTFTDGILQIINPADSYVYFEADMTDVSFIDYGGYYYMNLLLDSTLPATHNLKNVALYSEAAHPSRFITELALELNGYTELGVKLGFWVSAADITTAGTGTLFDGLLDGVSSGPPNSAPTAAGGVAQTNQSACHDISCDVDLNAEASSDPDSTVGTNDDIELFQWYEDTDNSGTLEAGELIASGELATVSLPLGFHTIYLRVTDFAGLSDTIELTVVIDPAELSFVDIDNAYVKHNGLVKITGKIALPAGVSYLNINSVGRAIIGISSLGDVIDESVDFAEFHNKSKWKYSAAPLVGIEKFKIDWSGARFNYQETSNNLKIKTRHIGEAETSLQIMSCTAVTIDINGVIVDIDRTRTDRSQRTTCSDASTKMDRDNDGEDDDRDDDHGDKDDDDHNTNCTTNVTLPFALSPEMGITITRGTVVNTISVADYYTAAVGKYTLTGRFDTTGIVFSALDPNLSLTVALGDQGFSGTLVIDQATWTKIRSNQWKYESN